MQIYMTANNIIIRSATHADIAVIVHMLADDELGRQRENPSYPLPDAYFRAFEQISNDPNHELIVLEVDGKPAGTLQLMFLPSLSHQGTMRAQIESVRIDSAYRGRGLGSQLIQWAIAHAKERGAGLLQLTSNASRTDAHRFYQKLGFKTGHVGMKLSLK